MLNTLIFTVDNYILKKKNQCIPKPVKIEIVYSLVENDFSISYCKMLIILLYYTSSKYGVKQPERYAQT